MADIANQKSLQETRKYNNLRPTGTILERVHRIQKIGMEVICGMIVGFDNDDEDIFEAQRVFIREARIINVMLGMLYAIPKTPLHARLAREGRLDFTDVSEFGTNVIPLRLSREQLRDGYVEVMHDLHEPHAYFDRLDDLCLTAGLDLDKGTARYWRRHPLRRLKQQAEKLAVAAVLFWRLMNRVPDGKLRREYRQRIGRLLRKRPNPDLLLLYLGKCAMHYHAHTMTKEMASKSSPVYSTL